jgi:hypothetical protein
LSSARTIANAAPPPSWYDVSIESVRRAAHVGLGAHAVHHHLELRGRRSASSIASWIGAPAGLAGRFHLVADFARRIAGIGRGQRIGRVGLRQIHDGHVEAEQEPRAIRQGEQAVGDDLGGLPHDFLPALAAERAADAREEQPQVVVDLGGRADRRARVADAVLLPDRDRGADAVDAIDVRLLHPLQELAGVGRQRLDVAPLPLGVDRVEGERRLARPADPGDDDQRCRRAASRRRS